jgi:hypothetical protein
MKLSAAPTRTESSSAYLKFLGLGSYILVCLLLLFTYRLFANCHEWVDDFWHHSAIVSTLMRTPFPDSNPFTGHPPAIIPYWPYHFVVASFANIFHLPAQIALANAGYFNLLFFALAFWGFVRKISKDELAPFVSIVMCLLAWGNNPWNYSGFIHLNLLFYTLSYPSMFAISAAFLCYSLLSNYFEGGNWIDATLACFLAILVILIHPLTFLVLGSLLAGISICSYRNNSPRILTTIPILSAVTFTAIWFWPFLPLSEILSNDYFKSDLNAEVMYTKVASRILPSLLGILVIGLRFYRNRSDALFWASSFLISIYAYGFVSHNWNFGRVIACFVLLLQVALGCQISEFLSSSLLPRLSRKTMPFILLVVGIGALGAQIPAIYQTVDPSFKKSIYDRLSFLPDRIERGSFVLADIQNSQFLSSFGYQVLVFNVPPLFREEFPSRLQLEAQFISAHTSAQQRLQIARSLLASYILLEKNASDPIEKIVDDLKSAYSPIFENSQFVVLQYANR